MPNSSDGRLFSYDKEYLLEENKLTYRGASKSNSKTLEIGNQGGTAVIRFSNTKIGDYISNEDEEITHDASLLTKVGTQIDELKFNVEFDFIIHLKNTNYISHITLELPCTTNLIEEGTASEEITDGFVFKRM